MATDVKVKVCGLTRVSDVLACAEAGVDWIGLNFHPASPRRVEMSRAANLIAALPAPMEAVGLFVDRPPAEVAEVASRLGLRIVQLHGQESPEDILALRHLVTVRAFRLGDVASIAQMTSYLDRCRALGRSPDAVLIDGYRPGHAGGTGRLIAADVLDALPPTPRLILAGGLTPGNVAAGVARVGPWMVDVSSGVESVPGLKDPSLIAAFVRALRGPS
jgi:phosphoribosylanthranilate isomerase